MKYVKANYEDSKCSSSAIDNKKALNRTRDH